MSGPILTYCVTEKKVTECVPGSEELRMNGDGRRYLKCRCASCGNYKTRFLPWGLRGTQKDELPDLIKDYYRWNPTWKQYYRRRITPEMEMFEDIIRDKPKKRKPVKPEFKLPTKAQRDLDKRRRAYVDYHHAKRFARLTKGLDLSDNPCKSLEEKLKSCKQKYKLV